MIVQYIRDKNRVPYGVVVADYDPEQGIMLGYSRCCKKDRFVKRIGKKIAAGRMHDKKAHQNLKDTFHTLPTVIREALVKVLDRAARYYKQWEPEVPQNAVERHLPSPEAIYSALGISPSLINNDSQSS